MGASSRGWKGCAESYKQGPETSACTLSACTYTCNLLFTPSLSGPSPRQGLDQVWAGEKIKASEDQGAADISWLVYDG